MYCAATSRQTSALADSATRPQLPIATLAWLPPAATALRHAVQAGPAETLRGAKCGMWRGMGVSYWFDSRGDDCGDGHFDTVTIGLIKGDRFDVGFSATNIDPAHDLGYCGLNWCQCQLPFALHTCEVDGVVFFKCSPVTAERAPDALHHSGNVQVVL